VIKCSAEGVKNRSISCYWEHAPSQSFECRLSSRGEGKGYATMLASFSLTQPLSLGNPEMAKTVRHSSLAG